MMRRGGFVVVGFATSAAAVAMLAMTTDVRSTAAVLSMANLAPLGVIIAVVGVQLLVRALRWSTLIPTPERVPARRLVSPLLIGYLGNAVLPARLGEPMRALLVARRERVGVPESLGTVLVERVVDVVTLTTVAFAAAVLVGAPSWIVQGLGLASGIGVAVMLFLLTLGLSSVMRVIGRVAALSRTRARDVADRFASVVGGRSRRQALLMAMVLSAVAWLLDGATFWLAGHVVRADLPYAAALLVAGVTVLGTAIPSAPGYVGTFELAAAGTAVLLGVPRAEALGLAVVAHLVTVGPLALGGAAAVAALGANFGEVAKAAEARGRA